MQQVSLIFLAFPRLFSSVSVIFYVSMIIRLEIAVLYCTLVLSFLLEICLELWWITELCNCFTKRRILLAMICSFAAPIQACEWPVGTSEVIVCVKERFTETELGRECVITCQGWSARSLMEEPELSAWGLSSPSAAGLAVTGRHQYWVCLIMYANLYSHIFSSYL